MSITQSIQPSLFDDLPQIVMNGDSPRARRSDKATSHIAADASASTMKDTKRHVLELINMYGPMVGSEINRRYAGAAPTLGWRRVAWDTPRKRAGELADDGFLDGSETRPADGNNLPESVYRLTERGVAHV